jgi:hypothetical protein
LEAKLKGKSLPGVEIKYGGKTVKLTVLINTDEPPMAVLERVRKAVKGAPNAPMCLILVDEIAPGEEVSSTWEKAMALVEAQHERMGRA